MKRQRTKTQVRRIGRISHNRWLPPPVDMMKINFDGAVCSKNKRAGVGMVVRDTNSLVLASCTKPVHQPYKAAEVEPLAAAIALSFAVELGFRRVVLKGDSMQVIQALRENDQSLTPTGLLLEDAVRLLGPPARFEASKLKVVFLGEELNKYSGILPRTYILSHCDFTANLSLNISNVINLDQLRGWYNKDDVVAEWKKVKDDMCLHVHCYVSGPNPLLDLAAEFRYHIFSKELPLPGA
nr:protein stay-green like, chloroplastic [Quercus suber]